VQTRKQSDDERDDRVYAATTAESQYGHAGL
jgi:hypothetical protein